MTSDEQIALEGRWYAYLRTTYPDRSEEAVREAAMKNAATGIEPINLAEAFGLNWFDKLRLYLGWGVVKRKVIPVLEQIFGGNWRTTVASIAVAIGLYFQQNGVSLPTTAAEWKSAAVSIGIIWWGLVQKDRATGSQPGDPPTPQRILGAIEQGQPVKAEAAAHSVEAIKVTAEVAAVAPPTPSGI